jgi:phenylpropionate dioxygenase-like ring-hydroxylating dioxygenase large terminal subunit
MSSALCAVLLLAALQLAAAFSPVLSPATLPRSRFSTCSAAHDTALHSSATASTAARKPSTPSFEYDWRKFWYPVGYERDFEGGKKARPYAVSIFDEPLVLFRDSENNLNCVQDLCTHRAAKLSQGIVEKGNLYCQYHGWEFEGKTGACVRIPQLEDNAAIPKTANLRVYPLAVREGVVWIWMGNDPFGAGADIKPVPTTADELDDKKDVSFLYQVNIYFLKALCCNLSVVRPYASALTN